MKEEKNAKMDKVIKKIKRMAGRAAGVNAAGEWDKGLKIIKQGEELIKNFPGILPKELEEPHCLLLIQKMSIAVKRGYLTRGFEIANEVLTVAEKYGIKKNIIIAYNNIGVYYWKIGDLNKSLIYIDRGVMLLEEISNNKEEPYPIQSLVVRMDMNSIAMRVAIEKDDLKLARKHFNNLEDIFKVKPEDPALNMIYRINKARFLQISNRFRDKVKAEELYKDVIEGGGGFTSNTFKVEALVGLCELLLTELIVTGEIDIINEIKPFLEKLIDFAQQRESDYYLMDAYIMQGKLTLLTFEIKTARRILIQAQRIAERRGFRGIEDEITRFHEDLKGKLDKWKHLKITNAPLSERIVLAGLDELTKGQFRKKIRGMERVTEEEVTVYKDSQSCLVCKGNAGGFNVFICQQCKSIYCKTCAKAVIEIENACWTCETPIDTSKPVKLDKYEQKDVKIDSKKTL